MCRAWACTVVVAISSAGLLAFAQAPGAGAPAAQPAGPPPPDGEQLYMENCSECHGPEGDGVPNVDLGEARSSALRCGNSPAKIQATGPANAGHDVPLFSCLDFFGVAAGGQISFWRSVAGEAVRDDVNALRRL